MSNLKAKHWEKYGGQPEIQLEQQAAEDKPSMGMGEMVFSNYAIMLVQEAYNQIVADYNISHLPMCPEKGFFDFETSLCIGKFQDHFKLQTRNSRAGRETLTKMDELLVQMENAKLKPTFRGQWA